MSRAPGSKRKGAIRVFNTDRASEACESNLPHTGQLHGPCTRESGSARVSCTDRVRGFGLARVSSTGRVREACALISSLARGVLINTDRVDCLACTGLVGSARGVFVIFWFSTGRADWHGSEYFSARVEQFSSSEVGNQIFSQFSGFVVI